MVKSLPAFIAVLFLTFPAFSDEARDTKDLARRLRAAFAVSATEAAVSSDETIQPHTPCFAGEISCGQTKTGRVSVDSCEVDFIYAVGYSFAGTQGQVVTITGRSPEFAATIALIDGRTGRDEIYASNSVTTDGGTARINDFTLPYSGEYILFITPLEEVVFGDYTLTITCQTTTPPPPPPCLPICTPTANSACMLNDRFRVTLKWADPSAGLSGSGRVITYADARPVTDPVHGEISESTFWSMYAHDPNSLEALVRMIRGNSSFWVFVTGFASAEYTVTIQDMRNCTSWSRTMPFGSKEKITDFNAFQFP